MIWKPIDLSSLLRNAKLDKLLQLTRPGGTEDLLREPQRALSRAQTHRQLILR